MALIYDVRGLPECCGIGLVPGEPHTRCPRCNARYDTAKLAQEISKLRYGATPGLARPEARASTL